MAQKNNQILVALRIIFFLWITCGQPTSTEPHQDPGDVVGFSTTAGKSQRFVPVASARINVLETAHNLGVIVNSQVTNIYI